MKCELHKMSLASCVICTAAVLITGLCLMTTDTAQGEILSGMQLYSSMDTISGTTVPDDISSYGGTTAYDGTIVLGGSGTIGRVTDPTRGEVLGLVSSNRDDYVTYGDVLEPGTTSYTAAFWFKLNDTGYSQMLATKGCNRSSAHDGWCTSYSSGSQVINFRVNYEDGEGNDYRPSIAKAFSGDDFGEWHHLAVVIDQENGMLKAYLDGLGSGSTGTDNGWIPNEERGYTFPTGTEFDASEGAQYGEKYDELVLGLSRYGMDCFLDDFAVWDRALTDQEILDLFNGAAFPTPTLIPGDANGDTYVDQTDAAAMAAAWGITTGASWSMGDFNGDGAVDMADASILAANWNPAPASEATGVPEPCALALLFGFALTALVRRGHRG